MDILLDTVKFKLISLPDVKEEIGFAVEHLPHLLSNSENKSAVLRLLEAIRLIEIVKADDSPKPPQAKVAPLEIAMKKVFESGFFKNTVNDERIQKRLNDELRNSHRFINYRLFNEREHR